MATSTPSPSPTPKMSPQTAGKRGGLRRSMLHSHAELSAMSAQGWRARIESLVPAHITEPADRRRATEAAVKLYFVTLGQRSAETRARKKAARAAAITAIVARTQANQEGAVA